MGGGSGCGSRGRGADRCCSVADLVMSGSGKLVLQQPAVAQAAAISIWTHMPF